MRLAALLPIGNTSRLRVMTQREENPVTECTGNNRALRAEQGSTTNTVTNSTSGWGTCSEEGGPTLSAANTKTIVFMYDSHVLQRCRQKHPQRRERRVHVPSIRVLVLPGVVIINFNKHTAYGYGFVLVLHAKRKLQK